MGLQRRNRIARDRARRERDGFKDMVADSTSREIALNTGVLRNVRIMIQKNQVFGWSKGLKNRGTPVGKEYLAHEKPLVLRGRVDRVFREEGSPYRSPVFA
jgi:hypothetical protein